MSFAYTPGFLTLKMSRKGIKCQVYVIYRQQIFSIVLFFLLKFGITDVSSSTMNMFGSGSNGESIATHQLECTSHC